MNYNRSGSHVFPKSHAVAALNSALYLSCPAGSTISSAPTPRHTHTHARRCEHPHTVDVCVHVQRPVWRSSASPMPLYGCMTHRPACPTRVDFHSWSSLLKHVLPPPHSLWPVSRLVTSCAYDALPYTWHIQSTRTCIRHLLILKNPFCFYICITAYRCPYGASALAVYTANNTARPASRFQCAFHQLTGLVTLSPELLNLGLNALREHRGWNSRPCTVFCLCVCFLCVCVCVFVQAKSRLRPWVHTACNHHEQSFMYTSSRDSICGRTVGVKG